MSGLEMVLPQRPGMSTIGAFQHNAKLFAILIPDAALKAMLTIAETTRGDGPIKVNAMVEFVEMPMAFPPTIWPAPPPQRHLKAVT